MKKPFHVLVACATLITAAGAFTGGCASTPTRESTGEYVDDSAITTKVKAELARDSSVSALDVKVNTYKGQVQLSGFVDTADQKSHAEQIARGVSGVQSVQNRITVK